MTSEARQQGDGPWAVADLAAGLRAGSQDCLAEIYRRWSPLVHTYALRALGSAADAEDVTQQVFVSAWRSRHTLEPTDRAFPAWLVAIARHRVADLRGARARDVRRVEAVGAGLEVTEVEVDDPTDRALDRVVVAQALVDLGEPKASVLRMTYQEELTHQQIADRLDLPLGTVKSHARRGPLQLRARVREVRDGTPG